VLETTVLETTVLETTELEATVASELAPAAETDLARR
jgi:hypothetical protein